MAMTISELARSVGVGVETIRFYQRKGLLFDPKPGANPGATTHRHYGDEELRRLRFVRSAQRAGFSLEEIGELLALDSSEDRAAVRDLAKKRIATLDAKIFELLSARRSLEALAKECESGSEGPCPIIAAFEANAPASDSG